MRRFVDRGGRDRRVDLLELTRRPRTHREKQFDGRKSFVRAISPNAPERAAGNPLPSTDLISCLYAHLELSDATTTLATRTASARDAAVE
jgi:hypothetical protein